MARKISSTDIMAPRDGDFPNETRRLAALYRFEFYSTRIPCRNEHRAARLTSSGECTACTAGRWTRWAARHPAEAKAKREAMLRGKGLLGEPVTVLPPDDNGETVP